MAIQLSDRAKRILLNGLGVGMLSEDNPFINDDGRTFARYDAIEFRNADDTFGGVVASFNWHGKTAFTMRTEGARLIDGGAICLSGVQGGDGSHPVGAVKNNSITLPTSCRIGMLSVTPAPSQSLLR